MQTRNIVNQKKQLFHQQNATVHCNPLLPSTGALMFDGTSNDTTKTFDKQTTSLENNKFIPTK